MAIVPLNSDDGLLRSAIARPINKHGHGKTDLCALAAPYAFGIVRNHPFADGNKRTAWVMARVFLKLNAVEIAFDKGEATRMMIALAAGELAKEQVAVWFRERMM